MAVNQLSAFVLRYRVNELLLCSFHTLCVRTGILERVKSNVVIGVIQLLIGRYDETVGCLTDSLILQICAQ